MNLDDFTIKERYILGLSQDNLDMLLRNKPIKIDYNIGLKGNFININKILTRESAKLINIAEYIQLVIKEIYAVEKKVDISEIISWLCNGQVIVFTAKKVYSMEYCAEEELKKIKKFNYGNVETDGYLKEKEQIEKKYAFKKIKASFIHAPFLLSITEDNILKIFEENKYKLAKFNKKINNNCEILAIANKNKSFYLIIKSKEHIFCIHPNKLNEIVNTKIEYPISRYILAELPKVKFYLIDEIVDADNSLDNLTAKIKMLVEEKDKKCNFEIKISNVEYLLNRIELIDKYYAPHIIPLGELRDMENFYNQD